MSEYPRYERKMNPMLDSEASMDETLLFGEVDVKALSAASRRQLEEYDAKLSQAVEAGKAKDFPSKEKDELLTEGYRIAEEASNGRIAERPAMSALRREVMRRLDLSPEEGKNLSAYTLIGTPLHEHFGFTGVFKLEHKGKGIYVPFEHLRRGRESKDVAPVYIRQMPDPSESEKYDRAIKEAAKFIGDKIEAGKRKTDRGSRLPHRGIW